MEKVEFNQSIDNVLDKIISKHLLHFTCQFFEKGKHGLIPYGSGVLARIHDVHFLFTASHVAEALTSDSKDLFIRVGKKKYINVLGEIKFTDLGNSHGIDLAYIKLDSQMIAPLSKPYQFLTLDKIRKHNNLLDASNYCVIGFPEKNVSHVKGYLDTGASVYFTIPANENRYEYYNYSKKDWFILDLKGKGTDIKTGLKSKIGGDFYGLSGCGLWYITLAYNELTSDYDYDYRLIGIMTEFKKGKYYCLIGNKIHFIIEALQILENMQFKEIAIS